MKMTRFAFAAKGGGFGLRSYTRSLAAAASAANSCSCWNIEFTAIAPNPIAASCKACLRVINLFMTLYLRLTHPGRPGTGASASKAYPNCLVTVQESVCTEHRLDEQTEAFLRIRFCRDGLFRDFLLSRRRRP